ncbi:MAG: hypothetical protein PHH26_07175 [Candidatus Thermoplasmatota archaeon]|nr:hypothetical protein [Candidatus Thermoplasmatota archaeon]
MKNILAIFAIGLMLMAAFSGCVGSEKTAGNDGTTGGTIGNGGAVGSNNSAGGASGGSNPSGSSSGSGGTGSGSTTGGNQTSGNHTSGNQTTGNATEGNATVVYSKSVEGSTIIAPTGAEQLTLGFVGLVDSQYTWTFNTEPNEFTLIANYTSTMGNYQIVVWDPANTNVASATGSSGQVVVKVDKKIIKSSGWEGTWRCTMYTGAVYAGDPMVQGSFKLTVLSDNADLSDLAPYSMV